MVADEEHVADQGIEAVAQVFCVLHGRLLAKEVATLAVVGSKGGKEGLHLALGVEGFLHPIIVVGLALQEVVANEGRLLMEHPVEDPVGDEGRGEEFLLPMEAIALYLLARQGQGGLKLSEQTVDGVDGNLPDTEETEHMVDTVGVEETGHALEATHPPLASVAEHLLPVVGGESPVLPVDGEVVGGRTSLAVEVEVAGLHPYVTTIAADANGDIALEDHVLLARIGVGLRHLGEEEVLDVVEERHLAIGFRAGRGERLAVVLVPLLMGGPGREVGRSVAVAEAAILGIGHEPALVLLEELPIGLGCHHALPVLGEQQAEVARLGLLYALIVDLRQVVEFATQLLVGDTRLLVGQRGKADKSTYCGWMAKMEMQL